MAGKPDQLGTGHTAQWADQSPISHGKLDQSAFSNQICQNVGRITDQLEKLLQERICSNCGTFSDRRRRLQQTKKNS